jgi:hypothetical protein
LRRTILIATTSVFVLCAGLWIGAIIGVGALAAPAAFQNLDGIVRDGSPVAGYVVGAALRRLNSVSVVFLAIMFAVALFELFYRQRRNATRLMVVRLLLVLGAFLLTLYLGQLMMPAMEMARAQMQTGAFDRMHAQYKSVGWIQVLLGTLAIVLTSAINIGPRRDGGHPRGPVAGDGPD